MPRTSVIIPMFQAAETVADTVRSALADDAAGDSEIIVVNDGSTDGGPGIVAEFAAADPRVRLVCRENGGLAAARNTGIAHARGDYLRFLDADDWALPGGTDRLVAESERTGLGAACGTFALRDNEGREMERSVPPRAGRDRTVSIEQLVCSNAMGIGTVVVRRDVLGEDRFDGRRWGCEDWDLWMRLAARGVRFGVVPEPAVKAYRLRSGSMSKDFRRMLVTALDIQGLALERARGAALSCGVRATVNHRVGQAEGDVALAHAAMAAACGDPDRGLALLELAPSASARRWSAAELGAAGVWGVLQGLGERPDEPHGSPPWVMALDEFWHVLSDHGRTNGECADQAWSAFASAAVSDDQVADRIARDLCGERVRTVTLWGMGRNGRLLAARLLSQGIGVRARDARWADGSAPDHELGVLAGNGPGPAFTPESLDAPAEDGAPIVVTPEHDGELMKRMGAEGERPGLRRWVNVADRLGVEIRADLAPAIRAARCGRAVRS